MNAVIYARYSSHNQTEQSIEGQLAAAYMYAASKGYTVIQGHSKQYANQRSSKRPAHKYQSSRSGYTALTCFT